VSPVANEVELVHNDVNWSVEERQSLGNDRLFDSCPVHEIELEGSYYIWAVSSSEDHERYAEFARGGLGESVLGSA
jgi:hypothetical protein